MVNVFDAAKLNLREFHYLGAVQAMLLKTEVEGSKVIKKEARNALLELAKDEYS